MRFASSSSSSFDDARGRGTRIGHRTLYLPGLGQTRARHVPPHRPAWLQALAAFAELESDLIDEPTMAGLEVTRSKDGSAGVQE